MIGDNTCFVKLVCLDCKKFIGFGYSSVPILLCGPDPIPQVNKIVSRGQHDFKIYCSECLMKRLKLDKQ